MALMRIGRQRSQSHQSRVGADQGVSGGGMEESVNQRREKVGSELRKDERRCSLDAESIRRHVELLRQRLIEERDKNLTANRVIGHWEYVAGQYKAELAEARKALAEIRRIPHVPFPDAGAHSQQAFSNAVYAAWCRIQQIASFALAAMKEGK